MEALYRKVAPAIPTPMSQKITPHPAETRFSGLRPAAPVLSCRLLPDPFPAEHVNASARPPFAWATAQDSPGLPHALEWTRASTTAAVPYGGEPHELLAREPRTASWTTVCAARTRREDVLAC
ncbi:hypothetical protein GCM10010363_74850 [Streptomyces omiyaensis]|nr:hypothetical protein GCM10010363_74850 [Streptomyces omiyaensis]